MKVRAEVSAGALTVRVSDNGPGVAPEDLPKIFNRFHKGARSTGSGLGLTIARSLVQAHGGEIEAENSPGGGLTIRFRIPGVNSGHVEA